MTEQEEDFIYLQKAISDFDFTDGFGDRLKVIRAMTYYLRKYDLEEYERAVAEIRKRITEFRLEENKTMAEFTDLRTAFWEMKNNLTSDNIAHFNKLKRKYEEKYGLALVAEMIKTYENMLEKEQKQLRKGHLPYSHP